MSFIFTIMFGILGIIMTPPQKCGGSAFGSIGILSKFWNFISLEKTLTFYVSFRLFHIPKQV